MVEMMETNGGRLSTGRLLLVILLKNAESAYSYQSCQNALKRLKE
jgi:hypothetical protein